MIRINGDGYLDAKGDMLVKEWRGQMFRPKYDFAEKKWIETATEEEIEEINNPKQIDNCSIKSHDERIKQLEHDKEELAKNVFMLAEIIETLLGGASNE